MAQGNWDDFTDKFGFNDGGSLERRDWDARNALVKLLNKQPEMKKANFTAIAWDRGGCHNGCFVILLPNPNGLAANKLEKAWMSNEIAGEFSLPDGIEIEELIFEAYEIADKPKRKKRR